VEVDVDVVHVVELELAVLVDVEVVQEDTEVVEEVDDEEGDDCVLAVDVDVLEELEDEVGEV